MVSRLEAAAECQLLPLSSFLALPMQRITRLPLLVGAVCQRLDTTDGYSCPREMTRCLRILHKVSRICCYQTFTRGVQKVLQLNHKEEWKCYKLLHFIFQYNHH